MHGKAQVGLVAPGGGEAPAPLALIHVCMMSGGNFYPADMQQKAKDLIARGINVDEQASTTL